MSPLSIDSIDAPSEIKNALKDLSKDYLLTRQVTKGGNGYLFFGKNRILNKELAIKFYYWGGENIYHAEPSILADMNSKNILSVYNAGLLDNEWAFFVTPYCKAGDLDDVLSKTQFGNIAAIDLTCQLLNGLTHLHKKRFLHRDIKPANIYIDDAGQAVIGDFGSIKKVPENADVVPALGHSILYTPPESFANKEYGFLGDIYQSGIVLFQLLGGSLPYPEVSWLSKQQLKQYKLITDNFDRSTFVDECLRTIITKGKLVNISTLPTWVPVNLRRTIRKAINVDPAKRFQNASALHVHLNNLKASVFNWAIKDGYPTLEGEVSYRIINNANIIVEKRKAKGNWRRYNKIKVSDINEAVQAINEIA